MTLTIFAQAILAPLLFASLAMLSRTYYPLLLAVVFWFISLWVKGYTLEAMDSVAIAFTIAAVFITLHKQAPTLPKRMVGAVQWLLLVGLSVWQVKNFASSISMLGWVIQFGFLGCAVALAWWQRWPVGKDSGSVLQRFNLDGLFWLIPVGFLSILSPIAGSLLVGQVSGLIAVLGLVVWAYQGWARTSVNELALLIAVPTLFIAQMAWHYVEIPWTSLALGFIGWVPLMFPEFSKVPWWAKLITGVGLFSASLAAGLYLEWPEQSLY